MTDAEKRRTLALSGITGTGAAAGGAVGLQALKLLPKEFKARILRKLVEDYPVIISSFLAPELAGGSGEARMALNIARKMREEGLNARFGLAGGGELQVVNTNKPYDIPAYRDSFANRADPWFSPFQVTNPGSSIDHTNLLKLNDLKVLGGDGAGDHLLRRMIETSGPEGKKWLAETRPEKQKRLFKLLLSGRKSRIEGLTDFNKALEELRSGKWDKFSPGRLATLLKLDNSLAPILHDGADFYLTGHDVASRLSSGRAAGILSGERGFTDWQSPALWRLPSGTATTASAIEAAPGLSDDAKKLLINKLVSRSTGLSNKSVENLRTFILNNKLDVSSRTAALFPGRVAAYDSLLSPTLGAGVPNLGMMYNFTANYTNPGDAFIPAASLPNPPKDLEELAHQRMQGRTAMLDEINRLRKAEGLQPISNPGKIIFMSGGSVGPNGTQKLIDALEATKDMDNVHIFDQIGGNPEYLDMVQNSKAYQDRIKGMSPEAVTKYRNKLIKSKGGYISDLTSVYSDLAAKYPGRFTLTSRMPRELLTKSITGADLYMPYGGSSSATEATGFLTPQLFTTDDGLNIGNLDYIVDKSSRRTVGKLDNASTALARLVKSDPEVAKLMQDGKPLTDEAKKLLTNKYRLGLFETQSPGAALTLDKILSNSDIARGNNAQKIRDMLSDAFQAEAFSGTNLSRVQNLVNEQRNATDRLVNMTKSMIKNPDEIVTRADKALKFGLGTGFRGGISTGLKGLYLRLGRALSKGAVNSRFAPALAGLGMLGGGVGSYLLGKKYMKDK